ncbi:MAG: polysaccharide biosynthesis tyrosine autokinase [Bacteroidetes bacterium]|nr:polysaccharide biosynthesis tyrosine autokinase [Bacteroidota bacterium]
MNSNSPHSESFESIDWDKLQSVVVKQRWWILLIFILCNLLAYLTIRYTKDVYQSDSEMKLDIKRDATDLGIKTLVEDQNLNIVSGEIEQMKSKVFFNRVIDSLDIWVSYFSIGNVLKNELYKQSPFKVSYQEVPVQLQDQPVFFEFLNEREFEIKLGENGNKIRGTFGQPLQVAGATIKIDITHLYREDDSNDYYFVINSRPSLVSYLVNNTEVAPLNFNANTISVSFKDNNAIKAYDIVNKVDSLYIQYSNEQKNLANKQKILWLNNELAQVEKRMQNFENYFETFTLKNKSSDLGQDLRRTIIALNRVDSQRFILSKKVAQLDELIEELSTNKPNQNFNSRGFLPEGLNKKLDDLMRMRHESDKLSLAYNENTFAYKQKQKELSTVREQVFGTLSQLKRDWLKSLSEMAQQKQRLEQEFATMPDKNTEFSKNQRFYKLYEEFYLSMMQSKAQFEIAQAGNTPDFKILSSATLPAQPISPKKYMILGIGFVASLVLNFFFIGISYLLTNKITSVKEIENAIVVPILGVIPISKRISETTFHVSENPKSVVSESIRTLRTNLDFFTSIGNKRVITISSTISGEGKSFLAANLGAVLAMSRKKVVLIDLDMRKQKSGSSLQPKDPSKGVSTILIHRNELRECIQSTGLENLDFIPAGPHPPNPSELLLNGEFTQMLTDLKSMYDYVVIDTPPVGLVTDGIMAMKRSDLSIYVVRANYSKREFLSNITRIEKLHHLTSLSVVLNAQPSSGKTYGYGYYEEQPKKPGWRNFFS